MEINVGKVSSLDVELRHHFDLFKETHHNSLFPNNLCEFLIILRY